MTDYYKKTDFDGNTMALISNKAEIYIVFHQIISNLGKAVNLVQVNGYEALCDYLSVYVPLEPITPKEFNETLFDKWGFDGSNSFRATEGESQNDDNTGRLDGSTKAIDSEPEQSLGETTVTVGAVDQSGDAEELLHDADVAVEGESGPGDAGNDSSGTQSGPVDGNDADALESTGVIGNEPDTIVRGSDDNGGGEDATGATD